MIAIEDISLIPAVGSAAASENSIHVKASHRTSPHSDAREVAGDLNSTIEPRFTWPEDDMTTTIQCHVVAIDQNVSVVIFGQGGATRNDERTQRS